MSTFFSFGAGVQSTAILLLIKHFPDLLIEKVGDLPEVAYFADTGAEYEATYKHVAFCQSWSAIPIEIVKEGEGLISAERHKGIIPRAFVPYFVPGRKSTRGMLRRKCTAEFKIKPIRQAMRSRLGLAYRERYKGTVDLWLGFSIEEAQRAKPNEDVWIENKFPLINLRLDRIYCASLCEKYLGYIPPKSRCFFCPYTSDWQNVKQNYPVEFEKAVEFDKAIRNITGAEEQTFIHPSLQPLGKAEFHDQQNLFEFPSCCGGCGT